MPAAPTARCIRPCCFISCWIEGKNDRSAPTDADITRWRNERLAEKYGDEGIDRQ